MDVEVLSDNTKMLAKVQYEFEPSEAMKALFKKQTEIFFQGKVFLAKGEPVPQELRDAYFEHGQLLINQFIADNVQFKGDPNFTWETNDVLTKEEINAILAPPG